MNTKEIDISNSFKWEEGLPRPQWDLIRARVETISEYDGQREAWVSVGRQWLDKLGQDLSGDYGTGESDHFLVLASHADAIIGRLLPFAERCRASLLSVLDGVADFNLLGKQVVIALASSTDYYRYISSFYPDGHFGGSAGVQIREGYPHVALCGKQLWILENSLAHELTHISLQLLSMPQWLEEGLAQMFEHNMTGRSLLLVDSEMAGRHKQYWGKYGLDEFWRGEGFSRPDSVQELSYQLAEILVRLLIEEARPRWFGLVREQQQRFFAFLRGASETDCGESACCEQLHIRLSDLAAKFLGPGSWSPSL